MSTSTFTPGARSALAALRAGQPVSIDRLICLRVELLVCLRRIRDKKARADLLTIEEAIQQRQKISLEWHDIGEPGSFHFLDLDLSDECPEILTLPPARMTAQRPSAPL